MSSGFDRAIQNLVQIIKESDKNKTFALDTQAEVLRVEDGTAWVHLPGGVDETPVKLTMNAQVGDVVQVRIAGGRAWLTGNATSPPTDDKVANQAMGAAASAQQEVTIVKEVVTENIKATNAKFEYVEADTAKIHDLEADEIHAGITYTNELIAEDVTTEKLTAASGYIQELVAENITAQNITADHAAVRSLDANYAKINAANITDLAAQNAWVNKIMIQTGLIAHESDIFTLDAIQVNAANITAGTIDVNRLIVTVNGQKYLVNVDPTTGTPSYEKMDGNIVEPRTITADKIVAHDITVQEITTENLVGTNGWINLNQGKFFYTTNGSTWANTTNGIMWDGTSLKIKGDVNITAGNVYTKTQTDTALGGKVGNNEVITKINASSEGVQIQAAKVDIAGAAVFNNYSTTTQMNTAIGNAVDGIEVGGRNYAVTTLGDIPIGRTETRQSGVTATLVSPAVIKLNGTATSNDWFFSSANVFCGMVLEAGTYACWATTPNVSLRVGKGSSSAYFVTINLGTIDEPYLFNITEGDTYWFTPNCSAGKTFSNQLVKIMIEKGNKATDWTPAPEDVQSEIDAKKSVHTISSAYLASGSAYATILGYAEEGKTLTYNVLDYSSQNIKVGDSVRLAYAVSDMNRAIVYINGTVTATPSATTITIIGHGLDTTIIDGGNILTNSIGANQIAANAITSDELAANSVIAGKIKAGAVTADKLDATTINASKKLTVGAMTDAAAEAILNSEIQVGGRNLLIERNGHASGASYANHTLTNTVADTKTSMQLMIQVYNGSTYEGVILGGQAVSSTGKYVKTFNSERAVSAGRTLYVKHNGSTHDIGYSFVLSEGIASGEQLAISFTVQSNNPSSIGGLIIKNIQLERGNVATDWSPAVEDRDESQIIYYSTDAAFANPPASWVTYTGKNLVSIDLPAATVNGVTYTPNNDFVIANGTINGTGGYRLCPDFTLPAGTYYAWCGGATVNGVRAVFYIGGRYYDVTDESKKTITLTASATGYVYLRGETSGTSVNATLRPMLYSSTEPSDAYEPYIGWNAVWTTKRPRYRSNFPNLFVATQTRHYDGTITCTTPQRDDTTTRLKYVTQIDEAGIRIHPSSTENNSVVINASGVGVFKGGTGSANSVAFYGDTARIGKSNGNRVELLNDGLYIYGTVSNAIKQLGYYGSFTRIGNYDSKNVKIDGDGIKLNSAQDTQVASFSPSTIELGKNSISSVISLCGGKGTIERHNTLGLLISTTESDKAVTLRTPSYSRVTVNPNDIELYIDSYTSFQLMKNYDSTHSAASFSADYLQLVPPSGSASTLWIMGQTAPSGSGTTAVWHASSDGNYGLYRTSSSSRRYKEDIMPVEDDRLDPHRLYDLEVVQFKYKEGYFLQDEPYEQNRVNLVGFIAEDVYEHYPQAAIIENEEVENWEIRYIVPPMLKLIQEQNDRITELERRLS